MRQRVVPFMLVLSMIGAVLVLVTAILYSYDTLTRFESGAGLLILLMVSAFLGWLHRVGSRSTAMRGTSMLAGLGLGGLWLIEISINNFIAPPLPARDIIDDAFWAVIALGILILSLVWAYRKNSFRIGVQSGTWMGFASGLVACCTALSVIVFAMPFITRDPLNVVEWSQVGPKSSAPGMESYFAFETLAGAFLHLMVLGLIMGGLLGVAGGAVGKCARWMRRR